jgi:hypothetical protein
MRPTAAASQTMILYLLAHAGMPASEICDPRVPRLDSGEAGRCQEGRQLPQTAVVLYRTVKQPHRREATQAGGWLLEVDDHEAATRFQHAGETTSGATDAW